MNAMKTIERHATKATWVMVAVSLALGAWVAGVSFSSPESALATHVTPSPRNLSTVATSGGSVANQQCLIRNEDEIYGPVGVGTQERILELLTISALCNFQIPGTNPPQFDLLTDFNVHQIKCQMSEQLDTHPTCIVERLRDGRL